MNRLQLLPKVAETAPDRAVRAPLWMLTFTDLVAILVTFFVLLFSLSAIRSDVWNAMTGRLSQAPADHTAPGNTGTRLVDPVDKGLSADPIPPAALNLQYLTAVIRQQTEIRDADGGLVHPGLGVDVGVQRLRLFLPSKTVFVSDGRDLSENGRRLATILAGVLTHAGNAVVLQANIPGGDKAADWSAALRRAALMRDALRAAGYNGPMGLYARAGAPGLELVIRRQPVEGRNDG